MSLANSPHPERALALARQLALAAHWGLEDLPCRPAPAALDQASDGEPFMAVPEAPDLRFDLMPYADVLGHNCPTPIGVVGWPIRLLRSFFKFVIGPWLEVQTLFNKATVKTLLREQASWRTHVEQLAHHVRHQQAVVAVLRGRLDDELKKRGHGQGLWANGNAVSARALEQVFLQAWLPRPPARLLALGGEVGLELAALGYQVVADRALTVVGALEPAHPDAAFDAVVCLARSGGGPELLKGFQCGLRSGGRAIVSATLDDAARQSPLLPSGFRLLEMAYAVAGDHAWTHTSDAAVVESLRSRGAVHGIALIAAEKN